MLRRMCLSMMFVVTPVFAGTPDIPDDVNARIARAKSEQAARASDRARARLDGESPGSSGGGGLTTFDNGCTIAVGNVFEDDKKIGTSAKRETTVIITGDIIQAGNNCR
ncbi:hypothetical protein J5J83_15335 [Azoarcus sp. L1K30]|uniref:hypothetical protein n=1 Tax=Azoarcus sp. L1K30 TaxID=2820277 RepID=UPI001B83053A|nr:hypothetical protein [Azoarcus sp. L1K30]MBR0567495.1 hypothetical protein [Azoarcus sp. L1K30]